MLREPLMRKFTIGTGLGESARTKLPPCAPGTVRVSVTFILYLQIPSYANARVKRGLAAPLVHVRLLVNWTASKRCLPVEYMKPASLGPALLMVTVSVCAALPLPTITRLVLACDKDWPG